MSKRIIVTGIGGNVGYGVLRNIRNACKDIFIIGTNTSLISAGNHYCDEVRQLSFATDPAYITEMQQLCAEFQVDLLIPTTDYESYYLALNAHLLPKIAGSDHHTLSYFLDKYKTYQVFSELDLPFAESFLPSEYRGHLQQIIAKPREGRGSRGLLFNPAAPEQLDDSYIIQPLLSGEEITIAFYVDGKGRLYGFITLLRTLSAGATNTCEVIRKYDSSIKDILERIIARIPVRGSCNLQCIVTAEGTIVPFEVNCRISGTNSIRSQFGFRDVEYTLSEFLYNEELSGSPEIIDGAAIRMSCDIIYPGLSIRDVNNNKDNFYIYE